MSADHDTDKSSTDKPAADKTATGKPVTDTPAPGKPSGGAGQKLAKCPICGKPAEPKYRPFCSQRCQQIDLGRWLGERYRIPAEQGPVDAPGTSEDDDA